MPLPDQADTNYILQYIDLYTHHPVANQQFLNFFPIFRSPTATEWVISTLVSHLITTHDMSSIGAIICPEAEGFILGSLVASRLQLPIIPVRKKGKLPGDVVRQAYEKWSGDDAFEMQRSAFDGVDMRMSDGTKKGVVIVDDSIASGGSVGAIVTILEKMGWEVKEGLFIMDTVVPEFKEKQRQAGLADLKIFGCFQLTQEIWDNMKVHDGKSDKDGNKTTSTG